MTRQMIRQMTHQLSSGIRSLNAFHRVVCRPTIVALLFLVLIGNITPAAWSQAELSYKQYMALAWAADRMGHLAKFEPLEGEAGMYLAIAERFGTVQVVKLSPRGGERIWKSIQLNGVPAEILAADLDGDELDDSLVCRTTSGKIYVWNIVDYRLEWESLPGEFENISCFTVANVDDDVNAEIVLNADKRIYYIDGVSFNRDFTGSIEFDATMIRCGDVDGDERMEIVLNTGQVLDSISGDVEWEDQTFYSKIELLDIDGDGIPEVLTEDVNGGSLKVYDVDYKNEVRFQ